MRCMRLLAALAMVLLMTGCDVRSLYPLYTEKDVIFEPLLLGAWKESGQGGDVWVFIRDKEDSYRVVPAAGDFVLAFEGRLVKLEGRLYLDLTVEDVPFEEYVIPAHLLVQIELLGDKMRTAMLDDDKLKKLEELGSLKLGHMTAQVLTALPKDLQAFVTQHAGDGTAFSHFKEFERFDLTR